MATNANTIDQLLNEVSERYSKTGEAHDEDVVMLVDLLRDLCDRDFRISNQANATIRERKLQPIS